MAIPAVIGALIISSVVYCWEPTENTSYYEVQVIQDDTITINVTYDQCVRFFDLPEGFFSLRARGCNYIFDPPCGPWSDASEVHEVVPDIDCNKDGIIGNSDIACLRALLFLLFGLSVDQTGVYSPP